MKLHVKIVTSGIPLNFLLIGRILCAFRFFFFFLETIARSRHFDGGVGAFSHRKMLSATTTTFPNKLHRTKCKQEKIVNKTLTFNLHGKTAMLRNSSRFFCFNSSRYDVNLSNK